MYSAKGNHNEQPGQRRYATGVIEPTARPFPGPWSLDGPGAASWPGNRQPRKLVVGGSVSVGTIWNPGVMTSVRQDWATPTQLFRMLAREFTFSLDEIGRAHV